MTPQRIDRDLRPLRAPGSGDPEVSVVVAAYRSDATLGACLEALRRQERWGFGGFEVVVVDSSPDEATAETVRALLPGFPELRLVRSADRLLPHAARNLGVEVARGDLLLFTDADVYPRADWLRRIAAAHRETGQPVGGALACHGRCRLDRAIHLCKFSKWLPGGARRDVDMVPTASLLVDRRTFTEAGGFDGRHFLSDTTFSWRLLEQGHRLVFEPTAVVEHHHLQGLSGFLSERYRRGILFAEMRSAWNRHGWRRDLGFVVVSLLPIRLLSAKLWVLRHAAAAGELPAALLLLPVWLLGHAASLAGEARGHGRRLLRRRTNRRRRTSRRDSEGPGGVAPAEGG